jgi:hypothetical protein
MKRNQAIAMYQAILNIKLNKMSEEMTEAILADTLNLSAIQEQFAKVQEELRKRTIETIDKDRLSAYDEIVTKMNALEGAKRMAIQSVINDNYADVRKAQTTYIKALNRWLDKEADVEIEQLDRKEFIKSMKESEQIITPADLDVLAPIFKANKAVSAEINTEEIDSLLAEE